MERKEYFKFALILALFLSITSCGGGGGGGSSSSPTADVSDRDTPANNTILTGIGSQLDFSVYAGDSEEKKSGTFTITLYYEKDGKVIAEAKDKKASADGYVHWSVVFDQLELDHAYWWKHSVKYTDSTGAEVTENSYNKTFYPTRANGGDPVSPRNKGYMDHNFAATPKLAVIALFDRISLDIKYDFELYSDSGLTNLIASVTGVTVNPDEVYAIGYLKFTESSGVTTLVKDTEYFWRSRYSIKSAVGNWSSTQSFTVKNFCQLRGTRYAEHVTEWTHDFNCTELIRNDTRHALGSPNAGGFVSQSSPGDGYVSIDIAGALGVEMGSTVRNGSGDDIRLYQYVSNERLEMFAAQSEAGPWYSLGNQACGTYCDFDLGTAGLSYARFFRIVDAERLSCYETAGAEVDSVEALNIVSSSTAGLCGS